MSFFGDDQWCVTINGQVFQNDLTRREAEAIAERYQRGFCKHKDFKDHVEIKRDKVTIKDTDEMYKTMKAGERQVYNLMKTVE